MSQLSYSPPASLQSRNYFGGTIPSLDRLRSLLILSGHGTIKNGSANIRLTSDFLSIPVQASGKFKVSLLTSKIPGCTYAEFRTLLKNAAIKNIRIHENIYNELSHCVAHYESKSYIASFVHLYRLIEHAALYLPLVSIVAKGVNDLTFSQYKEVVQNGAKADLSVLKNFSTKVLDPSVGSSVARYSFAGNTRPAACCAIVKGLLDTGQVINSGTDYVEIKYQHTDRLIVNFRNQFFHYLYHERNLSLKELDDPDGFLKVCLPNFLTYFAFLYREFLIAEWELWSR